MSALGASHREVKQLRRWIRDREARAADDVFVVEGPRALRSLLARGIAPRAIYRDARVAGDDEPGVRTVEAGVLERVSDTRTSQGVIAVFARPSANDVRAAIDSAGFVVVLSRVNDPGNLGTVARSAQAAGADAIVVGPGSVDPYNPKAVRAGAGAIGSLPVWAANEEAEVREMLDEVAVRGGVRLGAVAAGAVGIDAAPFAVRPLAVVFGHETAGLAPLPLDATFAIPMADGSESLNLAMAATITCFEVARRRRGEG